VSRETLALWRTLVPGILVLIYGCAIALALRATGPFDAQQFPSTETLGALKTLGVLAAVAIILGALYRLSRIRNWVFTPATIRIQDNIKESLLSVASRNPTVVSRRHTLLEGRTLIEVFYRFVDNHASLQEKAKGVRANGLVLSTMADLYLISAGICLLCGLGGLVDLIWGLPIGFIFLGDWKVSTLFILSVASGSVAFIGRQLFPVVEHHHIDLSNEQLDYIRINLRKELEDALLNI
jgi:hypothetical protein